jgi:hypothetical protein
MNLLVLAGVWLSSASQNLAKGGRGADGLGWVGNLTPSSAPSVGTASSCPRLRLKQEYIKPIKAKRPCIAAGSSLRQRKNLPTRG